MECAFCSSEFVKKKGRQRFCSIQCQKTAQHGQPFDRSQTRACIMCSKAFNPSMNAQVSCSNLCAAAVCNIKKNWGMTPKERRAFFTDQGDRCGICSTTNPGGSGAWHIDHDHSCCPGRSSCGKCIRGILCARCNPLLGYAHDDLTVLEAAISYLKSWVM